MQQTAIGVDVGGTGVRAMAVSRDGKPLTGFMETRLIRASRDEVVRAVIDLVAQAAEQANAAAVAVGVGIPAFLTLPDGVVALSPNLPDLNGWNAGAALQQALNLPVVVENDANAAAYGEAWVGAGKNRDPFVFLGIGTGLGGGIVLNGEVLHGARGLAAELGHLTVYPDGALCGCGAVGCVEAYASTVGLLRLYREAAGAGSSPDNALGLEKLARAGEAAAVSAFAQAGAALGIASAQIANTLNPQCIAIGGAVAAAWELFYPALVERLAAHTTEALRHDLSIVPAELGRTAGAVGAAGLAWRRQVTA
ncbi:MAG: ROK family protein [Leptospirillia bacterium]